DVGEDGVSGATGTEAAPSEIASSSDPTKPMLGPPPIMLWAENLTVSFDGFKALNDVTLLLDKGELRCIIGPNGAGKTTLMDVITGKTRPDSGNVYLGSRAYDLTSLAEWKIAQMGVGRK